MTRKLWKWEPTPRWIRVEAGGEIIADSTRAMLMIENPGELDYYFPLEDVRQEFLIPSDHAETSGYRGTRRFWHLQIGEHQVENGAWTYDAQEDRPDFTGYLAFIWQKMDRWFEEEEEVFLHPRNPYHRVDTIRSSRRVEVFFDGVTVAETERPYLLFETNLPVRYYIPLEDIRREYLTPSSTHSICPYKGTASYFDLAVNGSQINNAVWTYPDPIPESPKLAGKAAFWPEKDRRLQIVVDGKPV